MLDAVRRNLIGGGLTIGPIERRQLFAVAALVAAVYLGQFLALAGVLLALGYWRTRAGYLRHAFVTNAALMTAGFVLAGYQSSPMLPEEGGAPRVEPHRDVPRLCPEDETTDRA